MKEKKNRSISLSRMA